MILNNMVSYISRGITPKYVEEGGYCVLNQKCIRNHSIDLSYSRLTRLTGEQLNSPKMLKLGDILINSTGQGTLGRVSQVKYLHGPTTVDSHITILRVNNAITNSRYVGYFLKYKEKEIELLAEGSTGQTELSKNKLISSFDLPDISITEQQHIVDTIGSVDDLIELNEHKILDLEKILIGEFEQFYKSKCVKQVGLGSVFKCLLGGTPKTAKSEFWDGDINWINSGEVNNLRICKPTRKITKLGMNKSATKMLPQGTTVLAITGATLGQISLLEIDSCANQSDNNELHAFLALKVEGNKENYSDIVPAFVPKKRLKVRTLKVVANGYKIGERFVKIIFDNAINNKVDEIYVTLFPDDSAREELKKLFEKFGFTYWGLKGEREEVYVRSMRKSFNVRDPFSTYPFYETNRDIYLVTINQQYHTQLFPDSILHNENPADFKENKSFAKSIKFQKVVKG